MGIVIVAEGDRKKEVLMVLIMFCLPRITFGEIDLTGTLKFSTAVNRVNFCRQIMSLKLAIVDL